MSYYSTAESWADPSDFTTTTSLSDLTLTGTCNTAIGYTALCSGTSSSGWHTTTTISSLLTISGGTLTITPYVGQTYIDASTGVLKVFNGLEYVDITIVDPYAMPELTEEEIIVNAIKKEIYG